MDFVRMNLVPSLLQVTRAVGFIALSAHTVSTAAVRKPCKPIKGQPAFWDTTEDRCSPCSNRVCEFKKPLPDECLCHCLKNFSEGDYPEYARKSCQTPPSPLDLTEGVTNQGSQLMDQWVWLVWMSIISVVVLILFINFFCEKCKKCRKWHALKQRAPPRRDPAAHRPIYKPYVVRPEQRLLAQPLLVQPTENPPVPQVMRSPIQAKEDAASDETGVKCSGNGHDVRNKRRGKVPAQPISGGKSEGAPGHDHELLPKGSRTSEV